MVTDLVMMMVAGASLLLLSIFKGLALCQVCCALLHLNIRRYIVFISILCMRKMSLTEFYDCQKRISQ
jgi:hypothetical protein